MFCRVQTTLILASVKPASLQVLQRGDRGVVGARAAHVVVDLGGRAVERDLHVDVVAAAGEARNAGPLGVMPDAVGGELHADLVVDGVLQQVPEVRADRRLAAADVDVEDLHPLQLVDHRLALLGGQLARVAAAARRQAVRALEVAGVGELPGQADRRVEAELELLDQRADRGRSARSSRCAPRAGGSCRSRPGPRSAAAYAACCGSGHAGGDQRRPDVGLRRRAARPRATSSGRLRKVSLRLPKW